jgi:hypothetical protein
VRDELNLKKRKEVFRENGESVAVETMNLLRSSNVGCFIAFGSLLGLIREGHFLDDDCDFDIGFLYHDQEDWTNIEQLLTANGYRKVKQFVYAGLIVEQSYAKYNLDFDIFAFFGDDDNDVVLFHKRLDGEMYNSMHEFTSFKTVIRKINGNEERDFGMGRMLIPENPERFLEDVYGETWRIPLDYNHEKGLNTHRLPERSSVSYF